MKTHSRPRDRSHHLNSQVQRSPRRWLILLEVPSLRHQESRLQTLIGGSWRDCSRRALLGSYRSMQVAQAAGTLSVQARLVTLHSGTCLRAYCGLFIRLPFPSERLSLHLAKSLLRVLYHRNLSRCLQHKVSASISTNLPSGLDSSPS